MMSRVIPSRTVLILTISCAVLFSACQRDPKTVVVGQWRDDSATETMQFSGDGTVTVTVKGKGDITGTYSFPDSTHIEFRFNGFGTLANPIVEQFAVSSNLLELTDTNGKLSTYKRIQ